MFSTILAYGTKTVMSSAEAMSDGSDQGAFSLTRCPIQGAPNNDVCLGNV